MKRVSTQQATSLCVQPTFLIGTYNEDGTPNFAPITWICASWNTDHFVFVVNMDGRKKTKDNVARTGMMSANLVSRDMLELLDFFGANTGLEGPKEGVPYGWSDGEVLRVPTLDMSRFVYELEVERTVEVCDATRMYLCGIKNVQNIDGNVDNVDLTRYDPIIYSGDYHSLGEHLGPIGTFWKKP